MKHRETLDRDLKQKQSEKDNKKIKSGHLPANTAVAVQPPRLSWPLLSCLSSGEMMILFW